MQCQHMPVYDWTYLPSFAFASGDLDDHIAVLPLGATEQHGPHLPVGTDSHIASGMIAAVKAELPADAKVVFLPVVEVTNSVEHTNRPGTLSIGRTLTLDLVMELARSVHRAGIRKMVIINAHGGNVGVMVDASHAIRAELGMLCVATNWMRLGLPDGVIAQDKRAVDIHGGQLETAVMLALQPSAVDRAKAENFRSLQQDLAEQFSLLRAYGPIGFGWMGDDLNASGAIGDASAATSQQGADIVAHQATQMAVLLCEVQQFQPAGFRA